MKNYKKGLLALSILALLPVTAVNAATDERIRVTTFADENGENPAACSLREAITAAEYNQPFGGCSAGKVHPSITDTILLQKGEYVLTRSLTPASQINIQGGEMVDWSIKDAVTGEYPARLQATTSIKGNGTFSLFDTSTGKSSITLNNLSLLNGGGRKGGAILAGGSVYLNQVAIKNSTATEIGGAIYLAGVGSSIQINDSILENNQAIRGAVLAMSCIDNLTFTQRDIEINRSSILKNGTANTQQIIELCGNPTANLMNNTITQNTANVQTGSILKYTADSRPNTNEHSILSSISTFALQNNTVINNTAHTTFLYDSIGLKTLTYNILAYNQGQSCRHLLGPLTDKAKVNIAFGYNAVNKVKTSVDYCDLPYPDEKDTDNTDTTIDLSKVAQSNILMPLQVSSKFSSYMPVYFLKQVADNPIVDVAKAVTCAEFDQRNKVRVSETELILQEKAETCDIGALEQTKLRASDLQSPNISQLTLLNGFEAERDFFKNLIDDPNVNPEHLGYYKIRYQEFLDNLEKYPKTFRYRQVYYDIFKISQPQELMSAEGTSEVQHFDQNLYEVKTEALGVGPDVFVTKVPGDLPKTPDPNFKCEWNADLKRVLLYRTDGQMNQAGDFAYCKYTISLKSDPKIKSDGILQATFTNIVPVAEDDRYELKWGTEQRVRLDLLANDHDNGDGKMDAPFYPQGKKPFFVDAGSGISIPIKIGKIDSNLVFEAEYAGPCPDESGDICYGGEMYIKPKNSFNKFNYSFTYQVFDADGGMSNEATVRLISTATTTDDTRGDKTDPIIKSGKGGGGSAGLFTLFGLAGLAFWRRQTMKKSS